MNSGKATTEKFFAEVLKANQNALMLTMADALSEIRSAKVQSAALNAEGETALLRLLEIWSNVRPMNGVLLLRGSGTQLMAETLAQICAQIVLHPPEGADGLALCLELDYMMDCLLFGDWFE